MGIHIGFGLHTTREEYQEAPPSGTADDVLWSWFGLMMPPRLVLPEPDDSLTFSQADLTHLVYGYSGALA